MIEIENIEAIHKGKLLAKCTVHIPSWKMRLQNVMVFEEGAKRWVNMPTHVFENREGETIYQELISFDSSDITRRFKAQVKKAVDEYLAKNPDMEPEPVVKGDEEVPF